MQSENVYPIGKRVLLKIYESANETEGGLTLSHSDNTHMAPILGTVLKVGDKSVFKEGDMVFFRRYSVDELKFVTSSGEQKVHMVEDDEIIGLYKE